jgi:hypothetical protein
MRIRSMKFLLKMSLALLACSMMVPGASADETKKKETPAAVSPAAESPAADGDKAQAEREAQFAELLSGATLVGHFTTSGEKATGSPKEEKYTITKISKIQGDLWLFQVRIQYGDRDVTLPLPLPVKWAGDTPMIYLNNMPIPGMGTFSARVVFAEGKYAGTWSAKDHGGHLYGRIVSAETEKEEAAVEKDKK